jgi:predicted small lipoprotein YifL
MASRALPLRATALLLCVAALLAGCGRRGPLEPPPEAGAKPAAQGSSAATARSQGRPPATTLATQSGAAVQDTPDDETASEDLLSSVNPSPNPTRRTRPYAVPKEPFLLDPLL